MRLIASDLDGTFTLGDPQVRREAVADWQRAGNRFGIVSGRDLARLPSETEKMGVDCDFFVALDGAMITDGKGKVLQTHPCPGQWLEQLLPFLFERGCLFCNIALEDVKTVFSPKVEPHLPCISLEEGMKLPYFYQISAIFPDDKAAAYGTQEVLAAFSDQVNAMQNLYFVDVVIRGMDKAQGIRNLVSLLGIPEENVITAGDNYNDIAMIEAFDSYAMESGVDALKARAKHTAKDVPDLIRREMNREENCNETDRQ